MVTEKMIEALKPLADAVFNDNGDMTVQLPAITSEDCIKAYFAVRELAALSTDAEPVGYIASVDFGSSATIYRSAFAKGQNCIAVYASPPAPSVAVKASLEEAATAVDKAWREKDGINCTEVCAIIRSTALSAQVQDVAVQEGTDDEQ